MNLVPREAGSTKSYASCLAVERFAEDFSDDAANLSPYRTLGAWTKSVLANTKLDTLLFALGVYGAVYFRRVVDSTVA
jgi:hypothetical protein